MDIDRAHCCCFTGHRPEKLFLPEAELKAMLGHQIDAAIADGYDTFISGMARGIDVYAAEEVMARLDRDIKLVCVCPYHDSYMKFGAPWRERCVAIAAHAAMQISVCDHYISSCFSKRNAWMVSNSSRLIAVFDGTRGGTYGTIARAAKCGLDVRILMLDTRPRATSDTI